MTDKKRSLLLITVDCLRADHCGFNGYTRPTTPFLDSLAPESVVVPNAMVAGAPTYYSLPALLASRMPLALGRDVVGLAPGEETLATALRQAGYATAAFSAANPYISPRFGYDQGFEVFCDFLDFDASAARTQSDGKSSQGKHLRAALNRWLKNAFESAGLGWLYNELYFQYCVRVAAPPAKSIDALRRFPSAEAVVDAAESWLAALDSRPFFLWIHLMDPHSPYYPPAAALRDLTGQELSPARMRYLNEFWNRSDLTPAGFERHKRDVIDLYDAGILWADRQIARLVRSLQNSNRWDDCVLALTADHGEEFLDHGRRYHAPVSLAEELARVPLLIRVADGQNSENQRQPASQSAGSKPDFVFSHLHLAPTLLEILNLPSPGGFQGTSLWRFLCREPATSTPGIDSAQDMGPAQPAVAECVYGCTNPFHTETLLSPRLLAVRDTRYKLVIHLQPGAVEELYDLASDPREQRPVPRGETETKEIRARLLRVAVQHLGKTTGSQPAAARLRSRLRDLQLKLQS